MSRLGIYASQISGHLTPPLPTPPVANPYQWLDADYSSSFTYSSSNVISKWADISGNNRDATQSTVANQPILQANVQNSKPAVRFSSSAKSLTWTSYAPTNITLFLVFKNASQINSSTSGALIDSNSFPLGGIYTGDFTGGISGEVLVLGGVSTGGTYISAYYSTTNIAAGAHQINVKNQAYSNATRFDKANLSMTGYGYSSGWGANTYPNYYSGFNSNGNQVPADICELIVYASALSAGDITTVENYLATKWGL